MSASIRPMTCRPGLTALQCRCWVARTCGYLSSKAPPSRVLLFCGVVLRGHGMVPWPGTLRQCTHAGRLVQRLVLWKTPALSARADVKVALEICCFGLNSGGSLACWRATSCLRQAPPMQLPCPLAVLMGWQVTRLDRTPWSVNGHIQHRGGGLAMVSCAMYWVYY